ncbi:LytTR family DNA-binding domain-containing protein [soil metagenome]
MTLTALIADDEDAPRAQLLAALRRVWPELRTVEAANGTDAWDAFLEHEPRVCFLDVRMPGLTGIEVAQRIGPHAHIVFVPAAGDHALASFDSGAVDYVLKPIDDQRLAQVVARVQARLAQPGGAPPDLQGLLTRLAGQVRKPAPLDVIRSSLGLDVRLVRVCDVVYFETDGRQTRVVSTDGEMLIGTPLKELVTQLDAAKFWQVHRALIVNREHIEQAVAGADGAMHLTLRGRAEKLPVQQHFQPLFARSPQPKQA